MMTDFVSEEIEHYYYENAKISRSGHLDGGDSHKIFYECRGQPDKHPVVILHGGPGYGLSDSKPRLLDPAKYQAISFDQRGCGRSTPSGGLENNTTDDLIDDIERLRQHLAIERWTVFGSSWGAFLGVLYAARYPGHVHALIANGIFLGRDKETENSFFPGGAISQIYPAAYERFIQQLPEAERHDPLTGYAKRILSHEREIALQFALEWNRINAIALQLIPNRDIVEAKPENQADADHILLNVRLAFHFYTIQDCGGNGAALLNDIGAILQQTGRRDPIPVHLVHGRYDLICLPSTAYELWQAIPHATLDMIDAAGHRTKEPGITAALRSRFDQLIVSE